ncbi:RNA-directed RNA polymerase, partial [Thraustotheca clavata]
MIMDSLFKYKVYMALPIDLRILLTMVFIIAVFLGYSSSQLREQSGWFYREPNDEKAPTLAQIYKDFGDFLEIPDTGKCGARLGQAFSTTTSTIYTNFKLKMRTTFKETIIALPMVLRGQENGARPRSIGFSNSIWGYKGVILVDAYYRDKIKLGLRPSMKKFTSDHRVLEVCNISTPMSCYWNRQMITVLSSLGVPDSSFTKLYNDMIEELNFCFNNRDAALKFVLKHESTSLVAKLLSAGVDLAHRHIFQCYAKSSYNKCTAKISYSCASRGIDDYEVLSEGCSKKFESPPDGTIVVVGRCPCLHPGDIRRITFMRPPNIGDLYDVIVFSANGLRPKPDKMASGDLDGDIYFAIWDQPLVCKENYPAMIPRNPTSFNQIYAKNMNGVGHFFVNYMLKDNLGHISTMHVLLCDLLPNGAKDNLAIEFAQAHAIAIDYAKTGIPATVPRIPMKLLYPDFMEKTTKQSYESEN